MWAWAALGMLLIAGYATQPASAQTGPEEPSDGGEIEECVNTTRLLEACIEMRGAWNWTCTHHEELQRPSCPEGSGFDGVSCVTLCDENGLPFPGERNLLAVEDAGMVPRALQDFESAVRLGQVLYVNLPEDGQRAARMDALIQSSAMLRAVPHVRIEGVVGRDINLHEQMLAGKLGKKGYNDIISNTRVNGEFLTAGALGCLESHVRAWHMAAEMNVVTLVMEDDVTLLPDFDTYLSEFLAALPQDFSLAYLTRLIGEPIQHALTDHNSLMWRMNGEHWGTYAYLISPDAARVLLEQVYPANYQVDSVMIGVARSNNFKVYMSKRNMVATDNSPDRVSQVQRQMQELKIPRIFHFIWLGADPLPQHLLRNLQKWRAMHPTWKVKLWTDANIPSKLYNQYVFDRVQKNAQRADVLRYEIVFRYGGVYMDLDFEPLQNIEPLLGGVEAFVAYENDLFICNGAFGAVPEHRLTRALVANLRSQYFKYRKGTINQQTGPHYMTWLVSKLRPGMERQSFREMESHIFFPYRWGQEDPGQYDEYSFAVHRFEKVRSSWAMLLPCRPPRSSCFASPQSW